MNRMTFLIYTLICSYSFAGGSVVNGGPIAKSGASSELIPYSPNASIEIGRPGPIGYSPSELLDSRLQIGLNFGQVRYVDRNQSDIVFEVRGQSNDYSTIYSRRPEEFNGTPADQNLLRALRHSYQRKDWVALPGFEKK